MADFDNAALWAENIGQLLGAHLNTKVVADNAEAISWRA
jgi:hypothetical protein